MIKAVRIINDNDEVVKEFTFQNGLNVILADIANDKKRDKNSRNGAGKTTLIEIIDFCLGGSEKTYSSQLDNWYYSVDLLIHDELFSVYRNNLDTKKIYFSNTNFEKWEIKPLPVNSSNTPKEFFQYYMKEEDWKIFLGRYIFSLNDTDANKYCPKYRGLISYFVRYNQEAFLDPFKYFKNQKTWQTQVYNAFLLNLNWEYATKIQELKDKKEIIDKLKKATKHGYFKQYTGTLGELESEKVILQNKVNNFDNQLSDFKVHPHYEEIQKEANELTKQIHDLSNSLTIQKSLLEKYLNNSIEEKDADIHTIELIYKEAGLIFPDNLSKSLEEIVEFHTMVIKNRKEYLADEINRLTNEINKNDHYLKASIEKRAKNMQILNTHNAIDEFNKLQNKNTELKARLNEIENHINNIKQIENDVNQNKKDVLELLQNAQQDLNERVKQKTLAIKTFAEIADYLYAEKEYMDKIGLSIDFDENGYKFNAFIGKDKSTGRTAMKIFDYDMTITKIRNEINNLPGFLIHDSDIFDAVDERQVAKALEYADQKANEQNIRYICFMNSDKVPNNVFSEEFKNRFNECIRGVLKDTEDGGLFGFRF